MSVIWCEDGAARAAHQSRTPPAAARSRELTPGLEVFSSRMRESAAEHPSPASLERERPVVPVVVTGSTGTIGRELVRLLATTGTELRAIYRDIRQTWTAPNVTWVRADLDDPRQLRTALDAGERLFLLTGNAGDFARTQVAVVRAAQDAGVRHIVKLSALGASDHSRSTIARGHWVVEQALLAGRVPWTMLRPHAFMQNWLVDHAESVRAEGAIYAPIGEGRVPFIDTRDIAAVAVEVLLHPDEHAGKKYVLTGPEAVSYHEVAAALSDATGRPVTYRPIAMDEARARFAARGIEPDLIDAMLAIAAYQKAGGPTSVVSPTLERLL
ncbi:MAG TPA: SDR family oxidoreductase, partial [Candidatus Deferrimicrobium sp.]|nr:SDR family oxidoreductase [Candidatus Deferrimicrobium sp.]